MFHQRPQAVCYGDKTRPPRGFFGLLTTQNDSEHRRLSVVDLRRCCLTWLLDRRKAYFSNPIFLLRTDIRNTLRCRERAPGVIKSENW